MNEFLHSDQLFSEVRKAEDQFKTANHGRPCNKYTGAVTTEVLRRHLMRALSDCLDFSPRDSFILGVPPEIDLLALWPGAQAEHGLCFQPRDVVAALEIKNVGSFGQATIDSVKSNFGKIQSVASSAKCCYVALTERTGFRWAVTERETGFPAYTLSATRHGKSHSLTRKPRGSSSN